MDISLKGKTALVSGSTQGIGLASARELAGLGARLILLARDEAKLQEAVKSLPAENGQEHLYAVADFHHPQSVGGAVEQILKQVERVDVLVNNTGGPPGGLAIEADPEAFLSAFSMHLICNQILVKAVVPGMKEGGYGRIVNIISTSVKQPLPNLGVSNTIRGAVANWSKTLANELGRFNITVNNVLPGPTNTARLQSIAAGKAAKTGAKTEAIFEDMAAEVPLNRIAQPEEIANAVAFLASPAASFINGINVPVDGGRTGCL